MKQKESVHLALIESNTEHRELQWRNIGYFMINGITQENRKLILKSLDSRMVCRLQIHRAKSQDTVG